MICIASKLPILQVGSHQLTNYETDWLLRAIEAALQSVHAENLEVARDIYQGVVHYLENSCPWTPLKIETLYDKVEKLVMKIGFSNLEGQIPMISPPVRISVAETLEEMDCQLEIAIFQTLRKEMASLKSYGVELIVLGDVKEAVTKLIQAKKWTKKCQLLHDEIKAVQEGYNKECEKPMERGEMSLLPK